MSNEGFRCNCQGCDATKDHPCEAAEDYSRLKELAEELSDRLELKAEEKCCPEISCDECNDRYLAQKHELTQLRARVKELEASRSLVAMDQLIRITEQNLELKARIRELEEAMPKPEELRTMADEFDDGYFTFSAPFRRMADRIEKAMKR